jgi:MFS family permease
VKQRIITRPILILSLVSLFTDVASEMLYPVMPLFLKSVGFTVLMIGILEGLAEATAGLSKGYFGQLSDHKGKRLPFVRFGYALSALSKPMMGLFTQVWWIFMARTADRLGKGIRTGARDAYLSDCTTPEHKGKVFGFHRALDTLGAFIGPVLALVYLYFFPGQYKMLFFIAFFPGIVSILLTFIIKEQKKDVVIKAKSPGFFSFIGYLRHSPKEYKRLFAGLLAFTLFNSSDLFLILMMKHAGLEDSMLIGVYIFYNLVYAVFAYPVGILGDRIGLKKTFIIGLSLFVIVYAGMAVFTSVTVFFILFFIYGIYAACSESIAKAWISNVCKKEETATAIGAFTAFNSLFALISSALAGVVWLVISAQATFLMTAVAGVFIIVYFTIFVPYTKFQKA